MIEDFSKEESIQEIKQEFGRKQTGNLAGTIAGTLGFVVQPNVVSTRGDR